MWLVHSFVVSAAAPDLTPPLLCLPGAELLYDRSNTFEFTSLVRRGLLPDLTCSQDLLPRLAPKTCSQTCLLPGPPPSSAQPLHSHTRAGRCAACACTRGQVRELETPGILDGSKSYPFEFTAVEKQCARPSGST